MKQKAPASRGREREALLALARGLRGMPIA
jgi:hypothetical protein